MKNSTTKVKTESKKIRSAIVGLFWLAMWQAAAVAVNSRLLLPGPWQTLVSIADLAREKSFYMNIGWTMLRCLISMVLSMVAGTLCAWIAYRKDVARSLLTLPVGFFKAVPVMAIIIYVILLVPADYTAIIVCFFMCFPIVYTNILGGLDAMDAQLLELADIYQLTAIQKIRFIYAPGILPQVKSAIRLIAGLSWKAVVAAEVLSIPAYSLGYQMMNAKYYLDTPSLFAYIAVIVVLSLTTEKLLTMGLEKIRYRGYEGSRVAKASTEGKRSETGERKAMKAPDVFIEGVHKSFGEKKVLENADMKLEAGCVTVVMGPSGEGKTTLARITAGLEKADIGKVTADCPVRIAMLFQEDRLIPWLNVYDNMALSLLRNGIPHKSDKKEDMVVKMAQELEISDALWKLPDQLSGGMKHRVAMGRTFLADANLMILDEPMRGLDIQLKKRIMDRLWKKSISGKTVMVITHNREDALLMSHDVRELKNCTR